MYGTTMIGRLADGVSGDQIRDSLQRWEKERNVAGYQSAHILIDEEGRRVINVAIFDSKDSYLKLADDPEQDRWYREELAPFLDGDPEWIDGTWIV